MDEGWNLLIELLQTFYETPESPSCGAVIVYSKNNLSTATYTYLSHLSPDSSLEPYYDRILFSLYKHRHDCYTYRDFLTQLIGMNKDQHEVRVKLTIEIWRLDKEREISEKGGW